MRVRLPAYSGTFYPSRRESLLKALSDSFLHKLGPGQLPSRDETKGRNAIGFLVPHAGYMYSGPIASHAYLKLAAEGCPKTVILLGPNHTGMGLPVAVFGEGVWRTPLGDVEVDSEIARELVSLSGVAAFDYRAHIEEHSLEVQLPFLQYVCKEEFKIVPVTVLVQTFEIAHRLGDAIMKIREELNVDVVLIATSDLNHYEPHEISVEKDKIVLEEFLKPDPEGVFNVIEKYNISACGPISLSTLAYIAKRLGAKPKLLAHATSGDVTGERDFVVGYASAVVPLS
ncbi:MAG: AmmeMemoRadiSam system protein B [Acidilobaceae archaeon]